IFGGEFPGDDFVSRFFIVHVLLIPGIILALVTVHLFLVVYHKHTQYAGPGRTQKNVVGYPLFPVYTAKAGGFFFVVFGITALMGALMQINPVWLYGPYNPAEVTAGSQPDWYMGWLEGSVRIFPGFESTFWGITISWNLLIPALIVPPAFVTLVALYPFIEGWITGRWASAMRSGARARCRRPATIVHPDSVGCSASAYVRSSRSWTGMPARWREASESLAERTPASKVRYSRSWSAAGMGEVLGVGDTSTKTSWGKSSALGRW
ncbi:cytochrome b N-terminal domain-containing protein, partial [Kribbella sp. NPDC051936]|uniref:cytochrome b N-terminal domain-containing protein n=1 Tax=Kribbella sp. NPDC051936 TaxID=3154946 RepID=UPI0034339388